MVNGNLKGIRRTTVERLEKLTELSISRDSFITIELAAELAEITQDTGREVCIYISRLGDVESVTVGEGDRADLEALTMRRSEDRLSGLRCIHTHPNGDARLSEVDMQSLKKLRFDGMSAIGVVNGRPNGISLGVLAPCEGEQEFNINMYFCGDISELPDATWLGYIEEADKLILSTTFLSNDNKPEKVLLLGHDEDSLAELSALVDTAGGVVTGTIVQKNRDAIGKGKLADAALSAQEKGIELAVYDDELTASEQRDMTTLLGVPVIDRTALILDIFAMRARSGEGQLQVELAQSRYSLTRLIGEGTVLSRQGGGIGTRGPGEKKLETDRRALRRRIHELEERLEALRGQRELQRKKRVKQGVFRVALVGYTNAGKSTLLNALTDADTFAENKLFATLDPLTRSCTLEKGAEVCFTDTVGFIRKLPHQLVDAFRSTLEETAYSDLLLHVCDGSSPEMFKQMQAVDDVLTRIGAGAVPIITVINKTDAATEVPQVKGAVYISAKEGTGIEELKAAVTERIFQANRHAQLTVPYKDGAVLAYIHGNAAEILNEEYLAEGTRITFIMRADKLSYAEKKLSQNAGD